MSYDRDNLEFWWEQIHKFLWLLLYIATLFYKEIKILIVIDPRIVCICTSDLNLVFCLKLHWILDNADTCPFPLWTSCLILIAFKCMRRGKKCWQVQFLLNGRTGILFGVLLQFFFVTLIILAEESFEILSKAANAAGMQSNAVVVVSPHSSSSATWLHKLSILHHLLIRDWFLFGCKSWRVFWSDNAVYFSRTSSL